MNVAQSIVTSSSEHKQTKGGMMWMCENIFHCHLLRSISYLYHIHLRVIGVRLVVNLLLIPYPSETDGGAFSSQFTTYTIPT